MSMQNSEPLDESTTLTASQARALVRLLEAAPQVQRRYHFFVWLQNHVHTLLPHVLVACGSYQRSRRGLLFECFHSVAIPEPLLHAFADADSPLMGALVDAWLRRPGEALALTLDDAAAHAALPDVEALRGAGLSHLVLHGVARPQRPSEIETLFAFAGTGDASNAAGVAARLDLLLPHLHSTYLRMQNVERELQQLNPTRSAPAGSAADARRLPITARERQVLQGVREGKSNQEIGEVLGISALTVKNHVQKILRKLGAANRAQAVAMTMALGPASRGRPPMEVE